MSIAVDIVAFVFAMIPLVSIVIIAHATCKMKKNLKKILEILKNIDTSENQKE